MFDSSKEYYDLEEVTEGLSQILKEPVTPSMLYDYIHINKLIPYVLYSGVVYAAQYKTVSYDNKPVEVGLFNIGVSCKAYFKALTDNIELLPHSIAPRIGYSSPLYTLEDLLTYKDDSMQALITLKPVGYRLFSLDSEINENSKYELKCVLRFKSIDLIQFSNEIQTLIEFEYLTFQLNENKKTIKSLKNENKSLKSKINKYDSEKVTMQLLPVEKKNLINSLFKGMGISIADYIWKMDADEKVKKGEMVQQIKSILHSVKSLMIPKDFQISKDATINEWLTDIAPDYAKKNGRPKKDDNKDIILHMKK